MRKNILMTSMTPGLSFSEQMLLTDFLEDGFESDNKKVHVLRCLPDNILGYNINNINNDCDILLIESLGGTDSGAEKFLDIACSKDPLLIPDAVVLGITMRQILKYGLRNLQNHLNNLTEIWKRNVTVVLIARDKNEAEDFLSIRNFIYGCPVSSWVDVEIVDVDTDTLTVINTIEQSWNDDANPKGTRSDFKNIKGKAFDVINEIAFEVYKTREISYSEKSEDMIHNYEDCYVCISKPYDVPLYNEFNEYKLYINDIYLKDNILVCKCQ